LIHTRAHALVLTTALSAGQVKIHTRAHALVLTTPLGTGQVRFAQGLTLLS